MQKYKKILTSCGVLIPNAQSLYPYKKRKKHSHVQNVQLRSVPDARDKVMAQKVAIQYSKKKSTAGKIPTASKDAKNAAQ